MSYPSILTVWDGAEESRAAFELAMSLARRWAAHLDVACLGVDRAPTGFYAADIAHEMIYDAYGQAREEAETLAKEARAAMIAENTAFSIRSATLRFAELPVVVGKAAWFQDLVVLPKPFGREDEELPEAILDAALFNGPAPVLIVPPNASAGEVGKRILIAWNGSAEAARALRAALPMLKEAEAVEAAMVDPAQHRRGCSDPGTALGAMLSRHGVNAEISLLPQTGPNVAETLLARARDTEADMIVMGAYGHSRFRERMIGGATRDMLKAADRPIFMAR